MPGGGGTVLHLEASENHYQSTWTESPKLNVLYERLMAHINK